MDMLPVDLLPAHLAPSYVAPALGFKDYLRVVPTGRPVDHARVCRPSSWSSGVRLQRQDQGRWWLGPRTDRSAPFGDKWFLYPANFAHAGHRVRRQDGVSRHAAVRQHVRRRTRVHADRPHGRRGHSSSTLSGGIGLGHGARRGRHGLDPVPHPCDHAAGLHLHDADADLHWARRTTRTDPSGQLDLRDFSIPFPFPFI